MPPPVNQGSKAALVTWTVVATVFGITMAVLAVIAYVGQNESESRLTAQQEAFKEFASDANLQNTRMTELRAMAKDAGLPNVYNLLEVREETMAGLATGDSRFDQAEEKMKQITERKITEGGGVRVSATERLNYPNLLAAVSDLEKRLAAEQGQHQALQDAHEELRASLEAEQSNNQQILAQKEEEIARLNEELRETQATFDTLTQRVAELEESTGMKVSELEGGWEQQLREAEDRITQITRDLENANERVRILTQENRDRFQGNQMIAAADGSVLRSPTQGRLYINIGRNQGVTNGMTFQVYDAVAGIPKASADKPNDLPRGKGSIQVIRVDPNSAEARVVEQQTGQNIREGDLIANLAYDKNVPVRFRIYGDFDLDNDGTPSPSDRDRMLTLVREFGGRIVDDVTVETDVLVIGKEPEVPRVTEDQLADPTIALQYRRAMQQREEYIAVREKALQLNVPILNQNQFLYYIGYFDQIRR